RRGQARAAAAAARPPRLAGGPPDRAAGRPDYPRRATVTAAGVDRPPSGLASAKGMRPAGPRLAGLRLVRLYLASRRALTCLLVLVACAVALRTALQWMPRSGRGSRRVPPPPPRPVRRARTCPRPGAAVPAAGYRHGAGRGRRRRAGGRLRIGTPGRRHPGGAARPWRGPRRCPPRPPP